MENLVLRQGTEYQEAITQVFLDISIALKAVRDQGIQVQLPEYVDFKITSLPDGTALTVTDQQVSPQSTETQETVNPAVTTTGTQTRGASTTTTTPAGQQTVTYQTGGDQTQTTNNHTII